MRCISSAAFEAAAATNGLVQAYIDDSRSSTPSDTREERNRTIDSVLSLESLCCQIADTIEAHSIQPSDVRSASLVTCNACVLLCLVDHKVVHNRFHSPSIQQSVTILAY